MESKCFLLNYDLQLLDFFFFFFQKPLKAFPGVLNGCKCKSLQASSNELHFDQPQTVAERAGIIVKHNNITRPATLFLILRTSSFVIATFTFVQAFSELLVLASIFLLEFF